MAAANNNTPPKSLGQSSSPFGIINSSIPPNQGFSQPQGHPQIGSGLQNQFQLSQAQANAQAQLKAQAQAHAAQFQAAHAQLQAQMQAQGFAINQTLNPGMSNLAGVKRPPFQKPPGRPPGIPTIVSPLPKPMNSSPAAAAARSKMQKLPVKQQLPERVASILTESALYTQLLEFESHVDAALTKKKLDIHQALKTPPSVQKTLRIYVFNTFANQVKTIPQKPNAEPPSWTLKIIGRILEEGVNPNPPGVVQNLNPLYPKFSSFFKRVSISLDQRLYPDNHVILWEQARSSSPHEGFEVSRKGDKEFLAHIGLDMNYVPEKFKLSPALSEVLGIEVESRPRVIAGIWHYVKAKKLHCADDPAFFNCDPPLQKVFGEGKMKFTTVAQKISQHLFAPKPIHLEHQVKLSGVSPVGTACYDVVVDFPLPIQRELTVMLANAEKSRELDACDGSITNAIRKIHEHRRRRAFFLGFSQSPVEFINALIESQSKDLKLVVGEPSRSAEKEQRADFFSQTWG
ncbi:unnamed protein product [Linum tenue]|uniref:DM2 domain-containing protein n=2 Tax=Linum tenue TaxID=586396 RepID=A0AAV0MKM9_9ROSI|nr:unnamed protein product [Linum tenue]